MNFSLEQKDNRFFIDCEEVTEEKFDDVCVQLFELLERNQIKYFTFFVHLTDDQIAELA